MMLPYIDIERTKYQTNVQNKRKYNILKRDGFKCVVCGSSKYLTIAHIVPVNVGRYRKNKHLKDPDNLQTKCMYCHLEEHHPGIITKHTFRWA